MPKLDALSKQGISFGKIKCKILKQLKKKLTARSKSVVGELHANVIADCFPNVTFGTELDKL